MFAFVKKMIGDEQQRKIKKLQKVVEQINALEPTIMKLSDAELKAKTSYFKELLANGKQLDDIKVEAFAVVREAAKRVLGLRHFDVQLIGGLVLNDGDIPEMATGEGKTLVASLPSYLRGLEGKGVHVITVNEYLAKRDRELIGKVHEFLGLKVGLNVPMLTPIEKQEAYEADITYGIGSEFGFDYLRDNMVYAPADRVRQRPYHFAIIDEIDSVLIDEAKTPLIIAGKTTVNPNLYHICARMAKSFQEEKDYLYDRVSKSTNLTDEGITKVERAFGVDNLYELEHQTLYHFVLQALRARVMFQRDVDYIVKEGKIVLVDMFTGRIMEGRSFSDGLHQALEAKEGLEITEENKTQALVTIQNYFRMYPTLSGMTGTAKTEETEFKMLYGMNVVQIPTNRPKIRTDLNDQIYKTTDQKYKAMTEEVTSRHQTGQPILIGTTSIIQSETVAKYLDEKQLRYEILNAKSVESEVRLISQAGQKKQITIATNMAGRGTDIMLGEGVAELGGLFVLGTEKHESRRIDNQLKGRSGRQGDPGASQFFISIEDEMMQRFAKEDVEKWQKTLTADETGLIKDKEAHEFVERIQKMCEDSNYAAREYTLKLDDIVNEQRNVIYTLRNKVLENNDGLEIIIPMVKAACYSYIDDYCLEGLLPEEWNLAELAERLTHVLPTESLAFHDVTVFERSDLESYIDNKVDSYVTFLNRLKDNNDLQTRAKQILLLNMDIRWLQHLEEMTRLKEGIGLRSFSQEDPMRIYQREGFELFQMMYKALEKDATIQLAISLKPFLDAETEEK